MHHPPLPLHASWTCYTSCRAKGKTTRAVETGSGRLALMSSINHQIALHFNTQTSFHLHPRSFLWFGSCTPETPQLGGYPRPFGVRTSCIVTAGPLKIPTEFISPLRIVLWKRRIRRLSDPHGAHDPTDNAAWNKGWGGERNTSRQS